MTVISSSGYAAKPSNPLFSSGSQVRAAQFTKIFTGSDTDAGDVLRIAQMNLSDCLVGLPTFSGSMTGASDCDVGIYKSTDGGTTLTVVDKDIYLDGIDFSSGIDKADLLNSNTALLRYKSVGELLSLTEESAAAQYFLCLTLNNDNTGAVALNITAYIASLVEN